MIVDFKHFVSKSAQKIKIIIIIIIIFQLFSSTIGRQRAAEYRGAINEFLIDSLSQTAVSL